MEQAQEGKGPQKGVFSNDVQPQPDPWGALMRGGGTQPVAPRHLSGACRSSHSAGGWGCRLSGFKPLFWHGQLRGPGLACALGVVTVQKVDVYKALYNSPLFRIT